MSSLLKAPGPVAGSPNTIGRRTLRMKAAAAHENVSPAAGASSSDGLSSGFLSQPTISIALPRGSSPSDAGSGYEGDNPPTPSMSMPDAPRGGSSVAIRACVRVRPLSETERARGEEVRCRVLEGSEKVQVEGRSAAGAEVNRDFAFHRALPPETTQLDVFGQCGVVQLIDSVLNGYAATVIAYGQTGAGKTYTIHGSEDILSRLNMPGVLLQGATPEETGERRRGTTLAPEWAQLDGALVEGLLEGGHTTVADLGIIPRAAVFLYGATKDAKEGQSTLVTSDVSGTCTPRYSYEYSISASFLEIYNEKVCDLLKPTSGSLPIRYTAQKGFYVKGLSVWDCVELTDVLAVLQEGAKNRRVAANAYHADSSRSHSLLTLYVEADAAPSKMRAAHSGANDDGSEVPPKRYGKIVFVDLAGSERLTGTEGLGTDAAATTTNRGTRVGMGIGTTAAAEGLDGTATIKETQAINRSLFTLGQVISILSERSRKGGQGRLHVPYRNSKLTQLLMDSFGGSSLCLLIACVSPAASAVEETMSTLTYALRCMKIRNRPVLRVDPTQQLIVELKREIAFLRYENQYYRSNYGPSPIQRDSPVSAADGPFLSAASVTTIKPPLPPTGRNILSAPTNSPQAPFDFAVPPGSAGSHGSFKSAKGGGPGAFPTDSSENLNLTGAAESPEEGDGPSKRQGYGYAFAHRRRQQGASGTRKGPAYSRSSSGSSDRLTGTGQRRERSQPPAVGVVRRSSPEDSRVSSRHSSMEPSSMSPPDRPPPQPASRSFDVDGRFRPPRRKLQYGMHLPPIQGSGGDDGGDHATGAGQSRRDREGGGGKSDAEMLARSLEEVDRLQDELSKREHAIHFGQRQLKELLEENEVLRTKLDHLQHVFTGPSTEPSQQDEWAFDWHTDEGRDQEVQRYVGRGSDGGGGLPHLPRSLSSGDSR
ncbi:unnamed protein product [Vitrella brassicaformis CCMP3155]|uniref:Kinesin-like protein n=2 Tax=Vitrella brassicaformis TaxID=1169539 RepID=A0A0G4EN82_VITBC|nr:unnamed protein product [Vitrella brassicaformis CCMP3155]|eukprot:CEL98456.1 unnamed protein product [Vitrella brassicaformis CCMP3155]